MAVTTFDHGGNLFAVARQLGLKPQDLLDFSASINPLGMPVGMRRAIIDQVDQLVHYPDAGAQPLKEALAAYHHVSPEQVCPANGSTELIYLLPRLVKGERALIIAPAFSEYAHALEAAGWQVAYHCLSPSDGFALSLPLLERRLAEQYDLLFLCNPGNPTGALCSRADIDAVQALCNDFGTMLVLDEAFIDFCGEDGSATLSVAGSGNGIVLRSMTKFYAMPGLRLGYAITDAETCQRLETVRGPWNVNALAQAAGLAALADERFREQSVAYVAEQREAMIRQLTAVTPLTPFPGGANYLLLRLPAGYAAGELCRKMLGRGLLIRDCSTFAGLDGSFVRVAVRTPDENARLIATFAELFC